jgi:type IV fimbrial biogenesis protein FimT
MDNKGLSLLEALLVLAVVGLLLLAYPSRSEEARLREAASWVQSLLREARSEAIRRGQMVAVRQEGEALLACLDPNSNGLCDPGEPLLWRWKPGGLRVELRAGIHPSLRLNALGQLHTGGRVVLRGPSRSLTLCLSLGGRIREAAGEGC